ncbi:hypothetical protein M0R88_00985 [Halorussus gelatinilyticus]|uniref:Uncharacterized protein n=1 Tax=Halorussus gelatinilyticus TaxID=2937524 RepID=A0A8U0II52_9EURY|nr:hypothetical protein [Halorussus gelatinilyticus]UPW00693.1 hypothetical protein M0R88_00985 [Halorussus gelatinilyticus]
MKTPNPLRSAADERDDVTIAHREYDDGNVVVVDFGPGVEVSVDFLGDLAIVVAGNRQFEFEMPAGATEVTTNGGLLLIRE